MSTRALDVEADAADEVRVYPPRWSLRILGTVLCAFVLLVWSGTIGYEAVTATGKNISRLSVSGYLFGVALTHSIAYLVWAGTLGVRMIVSPAGITYYELGFRAGTTWDNITGFTRYQTGHHMVDALTLREPAARVSTWLRIGLVLQPLLFLIIRLSGERGFKPMETGLFGPMTIPLSRVVKSWRASPLEDQLRRYAPHLFAKQKRRKRDADEQASALEQPGEIQPDLSVGRPRLVVHPGMTGLRGFVREHAWSLILLGPFVLLSLVLSVIVIIAIMQRG